MPAGEDFTTHRCVRVGARARILIRIARVRDFDSTLTPDPRRDSKPVGRAGVRSLYASFAPVLSSAEWGACGRCAERFGGSTAGGARGRCESAVAVTGGRSFAVQSAHREAAVSQRARRAGATRRATVARRGTLRGSGVTASGKLPRLPSSPK